jgi:hypothetical protein
MLIQCVRAAVRVVSAFALLATVAACGGALDSSGSAVSAEPQLTLAERTTVEGADGASVSYVPIHFGAKAAPTVRVAKDSSGAPPLPAGFVAAGAVYQFTPLGSAQQAIELRVPFNPANSTNSSASMQPVLLVSQPGEPWMQAGGVVQ